MYLRFRKHPLRRANLTVYDLEFRLRNCHKSQTLRLMRLIHASLNGILQATFLSWNTIVFRRWMCTEVYFPSTKTEQCKFCSWHWNTSRRPELSKTTSYYRSLKSQSCPLQNTTQYLKISVEASFYHKEQRFFSTSWNKCDICDTNE